MGEGINDEATGRIWRGREGYINGSSRGIRGVRVVQRGDNNDTKGAVPARLIRPIGSDAGGNKPGGVELQAQDCTHGSRGHPPPGDGVV